MCKAASVGSDGIPKAGWVMLQITALAGPCDIEKKEELVFASKE